MKKALVVFLVLLASCTPKTETSNSNQTKTEGTPSAPMILAEGKCGEALNAVPFYNPKKEMYQEIFNFYQKYKECMDAGIAQGMQTLTTKALSHKWAQLNILDQYIQKDPGFQKFIIGNIDSEVTGLKAEVEDIAYKSKNRCPKNLTNLCREIQTAAENALKAE